MITQTTNNARKYFSKRNGTYYITLLGTRVDKVYRDGEGEKVSVWVLYVGETTMEHILTTGISSLRWRTALLSTHCWRSKVQAHFGECLALMFFLVDMNALNIIFPRFSAVFSVTTHIPIINAHFSLSFCAYLSLSPSAT